jgi:hypothetical protein
MVESRVRSVARELEACAEEMRTALEEVTE